MRRAIPLALVLLAAGCTSGPGVDDEPGASTAARERPAEYIDADPAFSPDGSQIAFVRGRAAVSTSFSLHVLDVDSGRVRTIAATGGRYHRTPAWSPDGRWIVFVMSVDSLFCNGDELLVLVRPSGRDSRVLVPGCDPAWEPRGDRVAYLWSGELWLLRPARDAAAQVAERGGPRERYGVPVSTAVHEFEWAPDGGRIAYEQHGAIWSVRPDGSGRRRLAPAPSREPRWSADGRLLSYLRHEGGVDGSERLWVVRADGTGARRVHAAERRELRRRDGARAPDGTYVVVGGSTAGTLSPTPRPLVAVSADGSTTRLTQR